MCLNMTSCTKGGKGACADVGLDWPWIGGLDWIHWAGGKAPIQKVGGKLISCASKGKKAACAAPKSYNNNP